MYTIQNEFLTVVFNEKGATLWSIKDKNGTEYLWQGDPKYWGGRAPNLFPYIGRMTNKQYMFDGKMYEMEIHGFAKEMVFEVEQISKEHIVFSICDTPETYLQYPFRFRFSVIYKLEGTKLVITYYVKNHDEKGMYFGVGGHPGFNVPLDDITSFEDWYLEFGENKHAKRVIFSKDCLVTDKLDDFILGGALRLPLRHDLFDEDAIVLKDAARSVTLRSDKSGRTVRVAYPDMPYIGFWHKPKSDAPYVCIEPWSSLPSRQGIVEDLATQPGLIHLGAKSEYENQWCIEVGE